MSYDNLNFYEFEVFTVRDVITLFIAIKICDRV